MSTRAAAGRCVVLLVGPLLLACGPAIVTAPFAARPDTVSPGDLQGPFDGQVLDADSGQPVEGAAVVGSWAVEAGRGLVGPVGSVATLVETNSDGRYAIERPRLPGGAGSRLARFTLVVYKRGYAGYRSDVRFDDGSRRGDFYQTGNVARLARLPNDVSHARHVAFVGAGGPLLGRLEWELQLAAAEPMVDAPGAVTPSAPPDVAALLTADELAAVAGDDVGYTTERLKDLPDSSTYASIHFRAVDRSEAHDAAIRVWRLTQAEAEARYRALLSELPGARGTDEVADRSLRAAEGAVLGAAALDRGRGVVLQLTCGVELCKDEEGTVALLRRLVARAPRLMVGQP